MLIGRAKVEPMPPESLTLVHGGGPPMRALVVGPATDRATPRGPRLCTVPRPVPPAPGWVVVRPALAGIGPSELRFDQPVPLAYIPGSEVVGVVEEARRSSWAHEGVRVLVEPNFGCRERGFILCRRCLAGQSELCENRDRPSPLGPAADGGVAAGGGWSEAMLVPEEMLSPAEGISDQRGVLAVPLATAVHAALRWSRRGDRAAVIGSGTVARLLVASLLRLHPDLDVTVIVDARRGERVGRRGRSSPAGASAGPSAAGPEMERVGAARVWRGSPEQMVDQAAVLTGARRLRGGGGLPILDRGLDAVFDCRGSAASSDLGLHLLRAGGALVLARRPLDRDADWALVWSRELTVAGSSRFGLEPAGWRTFAAVREWLADPTFPIDGLVTHRYPLDAWAVAVATAAGGEGVGAVKVVFEGSTSPVRQREAVEEATPDEGPLLLAATASRARQEGHSPS